MLKKILILCAFLLPLSAQAETPLKYAFLTNCWPTTAAFSFLIKEMNERMIMTGINTEGHIITIWENSKNKTLTILFHRTIDSVCVLSSVEDLEHIRSKRMSYGGQ